MMLGNYEPNRLYCGESSELMKGLPDECIDLTVTSPEYDGLRDYNGFEFEYEVILEQLYRITAVGGVVVWVVGDATINGSETGTSFKQALFAMQCGFNLHDTMIYQKIGNGAPQKKPYIRYSSTFEYMFIFSKGTPKTFNPLMIYGKERGLRMKTKRNKSGETYSGYYNAGAGSPKPNVWKIKPDQSVKGYKAGSIKHPAVFPESLARDHIISWSNKNDIVFDPFVGSGTTAKMAIEAERQYLGFDISQEYIEMAERRLMSARRPLLVVS